MKAAFATWNDRIAPVFDVARHICLVEVEAGHIKAEVPEALTDDTPAHKALRLSELRVGTLVCGAISRPVRSVVEAYGIHVIPFVAGDVREVIQAWVPGLLEPEAFAMPGCGRRRRRGGGGGRQRRRGRGSGSLDAVRDDSCVCPQCGHREPHERGIRCSETQCPACGVRMAAE